jgi:hypothetical protein
LPGSSAKHGAYTFPAGLALLGCFSGSEIHDQENSDRIVRCRLCLDAKVQGDKALKVLGVYVVDKTKPFASPAPWARTI